MAATGREEIGNSPIYNNFFLNQLSLQQRLGSGGFGVVSVYNHKIYGLVAVKEFFGNQNTDASSRENELEKLCKLSAHPNTVRIFGRLYREVGEVNMCGIVMERMPHCLSHIVHGTDDYTVKMAIDWFTGTASGLAHIHNNNIIHRDIKPANILLSSDLQSVRICDFGLCSNVRTLMSAARGTLEYMSPEMTCDVEMSEYGSATDIFSFAITMWEVIHRKEPYSGQNIQQLYTKIRDDGLRMEVDQSKGPAALSRLIVSCWDESPGARPDANKIVDTLRAMKTKLRTVLPAPGCGTPVADTKPSSKPIASKSSGTSPATSKKTAVVKQPVTRAVTTNSSTKSVEANTLIPGKTTGTTTSKPSTPKTKSTPKSSPSTVASTSGSSEPSKEKKSAIPKTASTSKPAAKTSDSAKTDKIPGDVGSKVVIPAKSTTYLEQMKKMSLKKESV